jgi:hypothetical protein
MARIRFGSDPSRRYVLDYTGLSTGDLMETDFDHSRANGVDPSWHDVRGSGHVGCDSRAADDTGSRHHSNRYVDRGEGALSQRNCRQRNYSLNSTKSDGSRYHTSDVDRSKHLHS